MDNGPHYFTDYRENAIKSFSHFPKSYGSFLFTWQPNQEADHHNLSYF